MEKVIEYNEEQRLLIENNGLKIQNAQYLIELLHKSLELENIKMQGLEKEKMIILRDIVNQDCKIKSVDNINKKITIEIEEGKIK